MCSTCKKKTDKREFTSQKKLCCQKIKKKKKRKKNSNHTCNMDKIIGSWAVTDVDNSLMDGTISLGLGKEKSATKREQFT